MKKAFSQWVLGVFGWTCIALDEDVPKGVICVAPHTSNWDFVIGKFYYMSLGRMACFLIKKEWFVFPFNLLFRAMGGIPVDRGKNKSVTDQMAALFNARETFQLAITPEGTRKKAAEWKRGFYYIAIKANVPILLAFIDYKLKEVGIGRVFYPTGDADADIAKIQEFYRDVHGRHPANFTL